MIQETIKEIKELNAKMLYDRNNEHAFNQFRTKRDVLISKLEKEIEELKDFEVWKEWKNSVNL